MHIEDSSSDRVDHMTLDHKAVIDARNHIGTKGSLDLIDWCLGAPNPIFRSNLANIGHAALWLMRINCDIRYIRALDEMLEHLGPGPMGAAEYDFVLNHTCT